MKYYISDLIPRLKKFSADLDQDSLLVDKPWVVSNGGDNSYQKLIFKRDGTVYLSKNGNVSDGKWEYLPEAQSLLIDYGDHKKLYNHKYLDEAVLALKPDGSVSEKELFLLGNENIIPDVDVALYLRNKYLQVNDIELKRLDDGTEIELVKADVKDKVMIDGVQAPDDTYLLEDGTKRLTVKNGVVTKSETKHRYSDELTLWQEFNYPRVGNVAEGKINYTSKIKADSINHKVIIKDGLVTKVTDLSILYVAISSVLFLIFVFTIIFLGL